MSLTGVGSVKRTCFVLVVMSVCVFAVTAPVSAQEGNTSPTASGPAGIGILILLMGLGAIVLVGLAYAAQARTNQASTSGNAKHTEEEE